MVGITTTDHAGFVALFPEPRFVADAAASPALESMCGLLQEWKARGRPTIDTLGVHVAPINQGWTLVLSPGQRRTE